MADVSLKSERLGLFDNVVLGVASAAPAATFAGVMAPLVVASGYGSPLALVVAFLPIVGIAIGFFYLNRWRTDSGVSYAWVGRLLNPYLGVFVGYLIVLAYVVSNSFSIVPAATTVLSLFSPAAPNNPALVALAGFLWLATMTTIVIIGIEFSSKFQWVLSIFEYAVLVIFAVAAVRAAIIYHPTGSSLPNWSWFSLHKAGGVSGLVSGMLVAVFWYSGWDTSVTVGEESKNRSRTPGISAITSMIVLVVLYTAFTLAFLSFMSPAQMNANNGVWMPTMANHLLPGVWGKILTLAILSSYVGAIETAAISYSRVAFSMGRDGVFPKMFGKIDRRFKTPLVATATLSLVSLLIFLVYNFSTSLGNVLSDLANTIGLMFAFYYAITGFTATWLMRRQVFKKWTTFLAAGLLPTGGGLVLLYVIYASAKSLSAATLWTVSIAVFLGVVVVVAARVWGNLLGLRLPAINSDSTVK